MKKTVVAMAIAALLYGCAGTPFKWSAARTLRPGMYKTDVVAAMGPPLRISTTAGGNVRYIWVYVNALYASQTLYMDFSQDGVLLSVPHIPEEFQD